MQLYLPTDISVSAETDGWNLSKCHLFISLRAHQSLNDCSLLWQIINTSHFLHLSAWVDALSSCDKCPAHELVSSAKISTCPTLWCAKPCKNMFFNHRFDADVYNEFMEFSRLRNRSKPFPNCFITAIRNSTSRRMCHFVHEWNMYAWQWSSIRCTDHWHRRLTLCTLYNVGYIIQSPS